MCLLLLLLSPRSGDARGSLLVLMHTTSPRTNGIEELENGVGIGIGIGVGIGNGIVWGALWGAQQDPPIGLEGLLKPLIIINNKGSSEASPPQLHLLMVFKCRGILRRKLNYQKRKRNKCPKYPIHSINNAFGGSFEERDRWKETEKIQKSVARDKRRQNRSRGLKETHEETEEYTHNIHTE